MKISAIICAAASLLAIAPHGLSETLPAGTQLSIRLRSEVSSKKSKTGDTVNAVLLAASPSDDRPVLSPGLLLRGTVRDLTRGRGGQARLQIVFDRIQRPNGVAVPLTSRIKEIDNARESVGADGTIIGLQPTRIQPSKVEDVLMAALYAHPLLLAGFEGVRLLRREMEDPSIHYSAGVDMTLELTAALPADALTGAVLANEGKAVPPTEFASLVSSQPLRTVAEGRPSDQINLLFIGTDKELDAAFLAAGWSLAGERDIRNDLRTFLAMFEDNGYRSAPVSTLTLDGRPPARVYEKQTNTFSKRHHIRIYSRPDTFDGKPVWLGAATHDVGIDFSLEARHFTHRVELNADLERTKILDDLRFTGYVDRYSSIPRPSAQREFQNATGDRLTTDGNIVAVILKNGTP